MHSLVKITNGNKKDNTDFGTSRTTFFVSGTWLFTGMRRGGHVGVTSSRMTDGLTMMRVFQPTIWKMC